MVGLQLSVIFQFNLQGFRNHKLHDVLSAPGTADLTADVDFSYLRKMAQGKTATLGPIKQREFLKNMGIDLRLQVRVFTSAELSQSTGNTLKQYESFSLWFYNEVVQNNM